MKANFNKLETLFIFSLLFASATAAFGASLGWNVSLQVINPVAGTVRWAIPEYRVGASSTNWDTVFQLTVRTAVDGDSTILWAQPDLATTTVAGDYLTAISFTDIISSSTYDVGFKTTQHLTLKLDDVFLDAGDNTLNFTQFDNSIFVGPRRLLAGDINNAGISTTTLGDDVVNAVDLSLLLNHLDEDDPTTRGIRSNFNQDQAVNSVDLIILIDNLDKEGER
jgi:hypothetical protein